MQSATCGERCWKMIAGEGVCVWWRVGVGGVCGDGGVGGWVVVVVAGLVHGGGGGGGVCAWWWWRRVRVRELVVVVVGVGLSL